MLRILPALAVLVLGVPATASAAPFGDLPFQAVKGPAVCLQATGAPGELVRQTETTAPFLTAGPGGLIAGGVLPTDGARDCVDVAGWPGGGGVLAFPVYSSAEEGTWVRGFLREPGHDWGEPIDILPPVPRLGTGVTVAASDSGDALVAGTGANEDGRQLVQVARRLPGGAFGAPEPFAPSRAVVEYLGVVRAGYTAAGEAVLTWTVRGGEDDAVDELWAAIAPRGGTFGPPQRLARLDAGTPHALAVGADGRALVVATSRDRLVAIERTPGGTFGEPTVLARKADRLSSAPVAVLRPGGGAVVAWTTPSTAGLSARTREQAGPFGQTIQLIYPKHLDADKLRIQARFAESSGRDGIRAMATADGRVMVTWGHLRRRDDIWRTIPGVAIVNFAGDSYQVEGLTGGLRQIADITPLLLADGSSAVAWSDNDDSGRSGRVHIAREGAPVAAEPAVPKVTIAPPRSRALRERDSLLLDVKCAAACDVYMQLADQPTVTASVSLPAAGSRELALSPYSRPIVPRGGGKVRVLVRSSAPGARTVTSRTLALTLRRARIAYPPRVMGLTVARDGDELIVRWSTAKPAAPRQYFVVANDARDRSIASGSVRGRSRRTRFEVRIPDARKAETVTVYAIASNEDRYRRTTATVPR